VPLLLIAPLAMFLLALSSVRTRRSAAATAMFGVVVMALATLLVLWGLTKHSGPYVASYQYISISVAFQGPTNFQTFAIQLLLHVDHLTVFALLAIEACAFAALGWHQVLGRSEPGAARFYAVVSAVLFAATGVLMSRDLATLFGFWLLSGALTYVLMSHRWGQDEPAARSRIALALPFLTDVSLLSGIAWLYSRYGVQDLDSLVPILHTNPGWTTRSLVVGAVLLFIGVAGRLVLWPFTAWVTQTASAAPTAAWVVVQSVWSVVGIDVLYRLTPILMASSQQALQVLLGACAVSAVIAAVLGLLGTEPRRALAYVGSAGVAIAAAVVVNSAYHSPAVFGITGVALVLTLAPARTGALLAVSTIANAMRTDDMLEMGDAWRRMRRSAGALLACAVVIGLSACAALAYGVSSRALPGLALGEAVLLASIGALRVFLAVSFGPLSRRRAFDPDRVREQRGALGWPYLTAAAGAALLVASPFAAWLRFLDGHDHPVPSVLAFAVWIAVALLGFGACAFAFARSKDGALAASASGGERVARGADLLYAGVDRFLVAPINDIARRIGTWAPGGDGALGRLAGVSGQLAVSAGRAPALPLAILLTIVVAVFLALVVPGIAR